MREDRIVAIERLGSQGDGIVELDGKTHYVPFALPGERWRIAHGAVSCETASVDRGKAICRHFTQCGGCVAQHMNDAVYTSWKRGLVADAFQHRGINANIGPLVRVEPHSRRRAYFGVNRDGDTTKIGFREERQHRLVDLVECPVLDPSIVAAMGALKDMARIVLGDRESARVMVTKLDHGLDVSFDSGRKDMTPSDRSKLAHLAAKARFVRLAVEGEIIVEHARPTLTIGGVEIEAPLGVFLQAVPQAEALLIELVTRALPKRAKRVADLFSGIGTFTFPLARSSAVSAFDSDRQAIDALTSAARRAQKLKPIEARVRDLFREPLSVREINDFDAIVFDPPRSGAALQSARITKSKVPVVVAVSCNPATLARDARMLIDGGYKMSEVTVIDQFLYSPHVEAVAVFRR